MIHDAFGGFTQFMDTEVSEGGDIEHYLQENTAHPSGNQPHPEVDKFERLMKEANEEPYPGCKKFSKMSFLMHLYRTKCMFKWSNESFNALLGLLNDPLPEGEKFPPSFYKTKKIVEGLGLKYEKIHDCPNDCMLYRKEFANKNVNKCNVCGASRWKNDARKIPAKRNKDGVLRHPADSEAWKKIVSNYPEFTGDPRNVRPGLASDGFNPFGIMRTVHSTWPFACPSCNINTQSRRLKYGRKFCYMGHRRFLKSGHKYRNDAKSFDGTKETRHAPCPVFGSVVLNQVKDIKFTLGQSSEGSKENLEARLDLKEIKIRPSLWPQYRASGRAYLPATVFTMSQQEKYLFYEVLQNAKFPDGYASNISCCVRKRKLSGLKTHDYHVIMQELLPLAFRRSVDKRVSSILIELCTFFRVLFSKELKLEELNLLEEKIPETLSTMEKLFLLGLFTVMIHLVIHLATKAKYARTVHYRWMYPIERYLGTLKSYVRNRACPEGSIVEAYIANECMAFCSRYLEGGDSRSYCSRKWSDEIEHETNKEEFLFPTIGESYGGVDVFELDDKTWLQAHRHVLFNCESEVVENYKK
uniref:Uncharacterized protein LOC104234593 n=1 Tax=Nicotiana sylvestris TaxID=4096 RepID=A0A1U7X2X7_NICSY|nr:PREDICTED: uncharacterized protein LOC104234593 [Nicotiana sylvestris]